MYTDDKSFCHNIKMYEFTLFVKVKFHNKQQWRAGADEVQWDA